MRMYHHACKDTYPVPWAVWRQSERRYVRLPGKIKLSARPRGGNRQNKKTVEKTNVWFLTLVDSCHYKWKDSNIYGVWWKNVQLLQFWTWLWADSTNMSIYYLSDFRFYSTPKKSFQPLFGSAGRGQTHRHFFHENPRISDGKGTTKKAELLNFN